MSYIAGQQFTTLEDEDDKNAIIRLLPGTASEAIVSR